MSHPSALVSAEHVSALGMSVPVQEVVGVAAGGIIEGGAEPPPIEQPGMYSHEATGTTPHEGMSAHSLELSSQ